MPKPKKRRLRKGNPIARRAALHLVSVGISREWVAIFGMVLGIFAGLSFFVTHEIPSPHWFWLLGMIFCLLRISTIQIVGFLATSSSKELSEDEFFNELPERVSDAVTLIGFGFAVYSSPWLGLAAALGAIFSAYVRSMGQTMGANDKEASRGPMTRTHRLILISISSLLMICSMSYEQFRTPIPQIALWTIVIGCGATIALRLIGFTKLRRRKNS
ncbi:hypothetical protein N9B73_10670 [Verrucomicrobiales bacterium]|jgi:hypothetical protein|nr:hypothetical protein [Verrucomicrobiales bacterium]